jgi:hypothetical protein
MWILVALGIPLLALAAAGIRGLVAPPIGILGIIGFFVCLLLALLFGLWGRRAALEDRSQHAAGTMLIVMAGLLSKEDDATLERIADKGGPAGEAAALLLQKRKSGK